MECQECSDSCAGLSMLLLNETFTFTFDVNSIFTFLSSPPPSPHLLSLSSPLPLLTPSSPHPFLSSPPPSPHPLPLLTPSSPHPLPLLTPFLSSPLSSPPPSPHPLPSPSFTPLPHPLPLLTPSLSSPLPSPPTSPHLLSLSKHRLSCHKLASLI